MNMSSRSLIKPTKYNNSLLRNFCADVVVHPHIRERETDGRTDEITETETDTLHSKVFTALHALRAQRGLATRSCLSVCLSVCPSVYPTRDLWQNERKLCPYSNTTWKNINLSFVIRRTVRGWLLYLKFWVKLIPLTRKRRFSIDICS